MGRKPLSLLVLALLLIAVSISLFVIYIVCTGDYLVVAYDEVVSMPSIKASYHSINNWQTVEDTEIEGVVLHTLLEEKGIKADSAEVKVIAPDGYFWPAVGTVLTLGDLKRANAEGLYPLLAWKMQGEILQPEPDGSGPLRLVMPQYEEGQVNKPSWVSNVRLIEIGPVPEGREAPDAAEVPVDEVWIYGDVPATHPFPFVLPLAFLLAGMILLAGFIISRLTRRGKGEGMQRAAAVLVLAAVLASAAPFLLPVPEICRAGPGSRVFSMAELTSMPAYAGHYTFLKAQEPFTYYEADYRGVTLSYLLEERLNLGGEATGVEVRARDGYTVSLDLSQVRRTYPGGLKTIIAYEKNGRTLAGDEGRLRLIVPQTVPGRRDQGGDANTPLCARMIYAVGVLPLPAGERPPAANAVPEGSLAVYGAVGEPPSAPSPTPQPAPSGGSQQDAAVPAAGASFMHVVREFFASMDTLPLLRWMALAPVPAWPLGVILPLARYVGQKGWSP